MKFGKLTKKAKRKGVEQEDFWEDVKFDNADAKNWQPKILNHGKII